MTKKVCLLCPRMIDTGRAENICPDCLKKQYEKSKRGRTEVDKPLEEDNNEV